MALVRTIAKQGDPKTGRVLDEIIRDIEYLTAPHAYRSPLLAAAESYDHTKASANAAMTFVASLPTTYLEHFPADLMEETAEVSTYRCNLGQKDEMLMLRKVQKGSTDLKSIMCLTSLPKKLARRLIICNPSAFPPFWASQFVLKACRHCSKQPFVIA